jgi:hypothetical protein
MPSRAIFIGLACCQLNGCGTANQPLDPQDASWWLKNTCGVSLDRHPEFPEANISQSTAPQGSAVWVSGVAKLHPSELPKVIQALSEDSSLRRRAGDANTYESHEGARWRKTCVVDPSAGTLYFRFVD